MSFYTRTNGLKSRLPDGSGRTVRKLFMSETDVQAVCLRAGDAVIHFELRIGDTYICCISSLAWYELRWIAPERCKVLDIFTGKEWAGFTFPSGGAA